MGNPKKIVLGVLPSLGGSIESQKKDRREGLFIGTYIPMYESQFSEVKYFSYANESEAIGQRTTLYPNRLKIHRYFYAFLMPFLYRTELRRCNLIRVMHLNGALPAVISKLLFGVPFISTYGYDYVRFARVEGHPIKALLIRVLIPVLLHAADGVIVTTEDLRMEVVRYIRSSKKIKLIPNGVNSEVFRPASNPIRQKGKFRLLFVGRLERQKNLFFMLDIIAAIREKVDVELTIVGSGTLENQLKAVVRAENIPVQFIDKIPYTEMAACYQGADCFISTSLAEGHPKALIEAMSCALPCVVSDCAGNSTMVQHGRNGYLLPNGSTGEWIVHLLRIASNLELAKSLGGQARASIIENYDISKTLQTELVFLKQST